MICFEGSSAEVVWRQAIQKLRSTGSIQEGRDQVTRELLHVAFTITDPRQRIVFGRPINPAFAIAEVIWIMSGANDSRFLSFWNPRMMRFVDEDEQKLYGAYGYRLGSQPKLREDISQQFRQELAATDTCRFDQVRAAYEALLHTPYSRQVVLQIWDSKYDMPNPNPRSRDVPCNIMSHLMIRKGKLEWLQVMRSNDLIWGTPYNFIQFTTMQEIIAGWLGVELGTYNHISDSLHIYERHWRDMESTGIKEFEFPLNDVDLAIRSYTEWEKLWMRLVNCVVRLTTSIEVDDLLNVATTLTDIPQGYTQWVALLTAEALRKRGYLEEAKKIIPSAGTFWATTWLRWLKEVSSREKGVNRESNSSCHESTSDSPLNQ